MANHTFKDQSLQQIGFYLLYTFSISWLSWFAIILGNRYLDLFAYGSPLFWIPYTLGSLGPAISSYLIFRQFRETFAEKSFVQYIFGKIARWQIWLIFALFLVWRFVMIWISFGISRPISILSLLLNLPFLIVLGGAEELGWRGILQPRAEKLISYIPSVLAVGTIWGVWHLPLWLMHGSIQSTFPFGLYFVSGIVLTSSLITLYKYTQSLFLCVLSHAWFNGCINLALYRGNQGTLELDLNWKVMVVFAIELVVAVILGSVYNRRKALPNPLSV
ncbi:MAG: CPBP family intramembrane metalloprotease [Bacteroidetes bacterium]|nr:MAG: CPBP family intramembrane metalloprotease [Bacteroidota bacterium]